MTEGTHLPEKIKNVWRISAFINFAVLFIIAIGCYIAFIFFNWQWLFWPGIGFGAIAIIDLIFELILVSYRYAFWRYNLTADAVELQSGYIFKKACFNSNCTCAGRHPFSWTYPSITKATNSSNYNCLNLTQN